MQRVVFVGFFSFSFVRSFIAPPVLWKIHFYPLSVLVRRRRRKEMKRKRHEIDVGRRRRRRDGAGGQAGGGGGGSGRGWLCTSVSLETLTEAIFGPITTLCVCKSPTLSPALFPLFSPSVSRHYFILSFSLSGFTKRYVSERGVTRRRVKEKEASVCTGQGGSGWEER